MKQNYSKKIKYQSFFCYGGVKTLFQTLSHLITSIFYEKYIIIDY